VSISHHFDLDSLTASRISSVVALVFIPGRSKGDKDMFFLVCLM
jgi:hypothetical protein